MWFFKRAHATRRVGQLNTDVARACAPPPAAAATLKPPNRHPHRHDHRRRSFALQAVVADAALAHGAHGADVQPPGTTSPVHAVATVEHHDLLAAAHRLEANRANLPTKRPWRPAATVRPRPATGPGSVGAAAAAARPRRGGRPLLLISNDLDGQAVDHLLGCSTGHSAAKGIELQQRLIVGGRKLPVDAHQPRGRTRVRQPLRKGGRRAAAARGAVSDAAAGTAAATHAAPAPSEGGQEEPRSRQDGQHRQRRQ